MPAALRTGTVYRSDSMEFGSVAVTPWTGDNLTSGSRSFPSLRPVNVPSSSLTAGARTAPVVSRAVRRSGWAFLRSHEARTAESPGQPWSPESSRFQPTLIGPQGNYVDTTRTDWNWPSRFAGWWSRVGLVALPSPGGATSTPQPRWSRVVRVPRYSVMPQEFIPKSSNA